MRLFNEAHSYATQFLATRKLERELTKIGRTLGNTRWFLTVSDQERYTPVVQASGDHQMSELILLIHHKIGVI